MKGFLEKNLLYLSNIDRQLAERMKDVKLDNSVLVEQSKVGVPTLKARSHDGVEIQLHSLYDPVTEARRFFETQAFPKSAGYAISGFGLGYHTLELVSKLKNLEWILILEAKDAVFRAALEFIDLAPLLTRKNVRFFIGSDFMRFLEWQSDFLNNTDVREIAIIPHPSSVRLLPQFYDNVANEINNAMNKRWVSLNTLQAYGELIEANAINNVFELANATGVERFKDKFKDMPAVVVAAGPSLNDNIDTLANVKRRAIIICVGKVLKLLLSRSIDARFVTHLDMMPNLSDPYFDGLPRDNKAALIFDTDSAYQTVAKYHGRKIGFESAVPTINWAIDFIGKRGQMEKGLTVAHTAFYFSRYIGANPIILIGVDLAFPSEKTHADGAVETWGGKVSEQKIAWIEVPSVSGGNVLSIPSFQAMVNSFEVEISKTQATVINTSSKGALIRGVVNMSLKDAMEKYCTRELDTEGIIEGAFSERPPIDKEKLVANSAVLLMELDKIIDFAQAGIGYGKRLASLDKTNKYDHKEYKKLSDKISDTKNALLKLNRTAVLLQRVVADGMLRIKELGDKIDIKANPREQQRLEAERVRIFFESYLKAAKFYKDNFVPLKKKLLGI